MGTKENGLFKTLLNEQILQDNYTLAGIDYKLQVNG